MSGWVLVALGVGLAVGYIYGWIQGRRIAFETVLEEAKRINKSN